jgi:hypothetical protein
MNLEARNPSGRSRKQTVFSFNDQAAACSDWLSDRLGEKALKMPRLLEYINDDDDDNDDNMIRQDVRILFTFIFLKLLY